MTRNYESPTYIGAAAKHVRDGLGKFNSERVARVIDGIHDARREGFPTGHEPPTETRDVDEDGNPTSDARGYSDRTGNLATSKPDPAEADLREWHRLWDMFVGAMAGLEAIANRYDRPAMRADLARDATRGQGEVGCTNHHRHDAGFAHVYRGTLCRWCYDKQGEYGYLPDAELVEKVALWGKTSDRHIKEWLSREKDRDKRRKHRRK